MDATTGMLLPGSPESTFTPTDNSRITIQIGERRFTALRDTLCESKYFAARLSDRWDDKESDGSFFIDSNPELFDHILNYLRSGVPPLFFDAATETFDYSKYTALLGEARYFGIPGLEKWISKARYLDAFRTETTITVHEVEDEQIISARADTKTDVSVKWGSKRVYVCPRLIPVHRGDQNKCGQDCKKVRERNGGEVGFEEEPFLYAAVTSRKTIFDPSVCLGNP